MFLIKETDLEASSDWQDGNKWINDHEHVRKIKLIVMTLRVSARKQHALLTIKSLNSDEKYKVKHFSN